MLQYLGFFIQVNLFCCITPCIVTQLYCKCYKWIVYLDRRFPTLTSTYSTRKSSLKKIVILGHNLIIDGLHYYKINWGWWFYQLVTVVLFVFTFFDEVYLSKHKTFVQHLYSTTFVQRRPNVCVGSPLYKCCTNVWFLLGWYYFKKHHKSFLPSSEWVHIMKSYVTPPGEYLLMISCPGAVFKAAWPSTVQVSKKQNASSPPTAAHS